jgi:hypothetical protein
MDPDKAEEYPAEVGRVAVAPVIDTYLPGGADVHAPVLALENFPMAQLVH